jgi:hypothetical protein
MNEILIVYCSILTGFALAAIASLFGAWLSCKIMAGKPGREGQRSSRAYPRTNK